MNLAGATVRTEHVQFLAAMVDGELAAKLNRAITNNNNIVALSSADRTHLLNVLNETTPGALLELRTVLVKQSANERKREAQADQLRLNQDRTRRRGAAAALEAPVLRASSRLDS
jgi:hypothetical protein